MKSKSKFPSNFLRKANSFVLYRYTLTCSDGFEVVLIDYGAIIQSIRQPDRQNQFAEVTLGYDTLQGTCGFFEVGMTFHIVIVVEYVDDKCFFGCTVGRVTNRIKDARFELDGKVYELEKNDGTKKHHLHGVFNKRVWQSAIENDDTVVFKYSSPDGKYLLGEFIDLVFSRHCRRRWLSWSSRCNCQVYVDE